LAVANDYATATASEPCSSLLVTNADTGLQEVRINATQPETKVVTLKLKNNGPHTISWNCWGSGTNLADLKYKLKQKTIGTPAWTAQSSGACYQPVPGENASSAVWIAWEITNGDIAPNEEFAVQMRVISGNMDAGKTFKSKLSLSFVTPAEATLEPPVQTVSFLFTVQVNPAQVILVFPFELSSTLRVGEKQTHDVFVFNIGKNVNEFGVVVEPPRSSWAEMDENTFCKKNATTTALNTLKSYCKVQNDRTFKKYSVVMNAVNVSSRTAPYFDTMVLYTTLEEQVSIRLKMQVNAGETNPRKTTVTGITNVTVQTPLSIKIEAKDILGGTSTAADTFFVEWKKVNFVNPESNGTLTDCQPTSGCSSGVIQSSPNATKVDLHIIDFVPQQFGKYELAIQLQGQDVADSPYYFWAQKPDCGVSGAAVINALKEACECDKGYYQASRTSVTGNVAFSCEPCPSNFYKDEKGDKPCTKCPAFSNTGNAVARTSSDNCKCNTHRNRTSNTGSPFECPCASGYGDSGGNCTLCAAGEKNENQNKMSSTCEKCEKGKSQNTTGKTSCDKCQEGKYSSTNGAISCTDCERGKYNDVKKGIRCVDCARGKYQDETGGKECKECPAGTAQPNTMSTYCDDCASGHYQNERKETTCKKCATGKIVGVGTTKATVCTQCPLHHWSCHPDATGLYPPFEKCIGQTDCSACPAGTQNEPSKVGTDCTSCVEGKFSENGGKGCQPCPSGFFAASKGATLCVECNRNSYAPRGSSQCLSCPLGLVIDKQLGPAKDESSCVCDRGSFLYPYIILSLSLHGESTTSVGFDSAKLKERVRTALGNAGLLFNRVSGLKTGLPLTYGYEKVTLSTSSATEGGFKAVFKIAARDAREGTVANLINVYNSTKKVQAIFQKYYDTHIAVDPINAADYELIKTKWANVASIEAHVYKQCEPCPPGGYCAFGSVGTENIAALPGFWRPVNSYARFWQCPIPSMTAGKLYPWLACYGGKSSVCGPVFNFEEILTGSVTIKEQLDASDFEAMPEGEFNYQQELELRNTSNTLDVAIVSYLNDLVYDRANVSLVDALDTGDIYVEGWSRMKSGNLVVGEYSGPMCTVCPPNSGRDGNFQSGTVCTPCPPPVNNILTLVGLSILVVLILGAMVASQVTKGSIERELLRKLEEEAEEAVEKQRRRLSTVAEKGDALTGEAASAHEHRENQQRYGSYSGTELSHKQILTGMFRILAAYLQVTTMAQSVPIAWTDEVREFMKAMEKISSPSLSMTSVDCAISTDDPSAGNTKAFFKKFYAMMLVPVLSVVVPGVFFFFYYLVGSCILGFTRLKCWPNRLPEEEFVRDKRVYKTKLSDIENVHEYNLFRHRQRSNRRFKVTAMIILFLFYTTICKSVVESFACRTFGSKQYLIADLSVECKGEDFEFHRNLGILCFIVYNLGIPFFAYCVLHPYIDGIHFDPTHVVSVDNPPTSTKTYTEKDKTVLMEQKATSHGAFGFLWQGLSEQGLAPYWEVVVISLRKLIMICVIMLMSELNPNIQMTVALLILFMFTLLHVNYRPYDAFVHDNLELFSLLVSQITLFVGLLANFFKNEQESDLATITEAQGIQINFIFGLIVVIVNAAFIVYFILSLIFHSFFMIGKSKRLVLQRWFGCCCICCKQCHEIADKVNLVKRNSFSYRSEDHIYDRHNVGDIEMQRHKRGRTIDGKHEQLLKLNFTVPEGVLAGKTVYVNSPSGHKVKVIIPKGAKAGQVISVTVPPEMPLVPNPLQRRNDTEGDSPRSDSSRSSDVDDSSDEDGESNLII
jgi:hypothetical protein